jgi:hypothetical protein
MWVELQMWTDELKGSRTDVTVDIALIKSRSDLTFRNTIGAIN